MSVKLYTCPKCEKRLANRHSLCRHKTNCHVIARNQSPRHPYNIPTSHLINSHSEIPRHGVSAAANSRERSEKVQDLFRKLNTAGSTPLDIQPVGEKPSPPPLPDHSRKNDMVDDNTTTSEEESSHDGSMIGDNDVSPAEDEEDDNMKRKVWRVIVHWGNSNDCSNALDAFKFFFRFNRALDHDATIEKIMVNSAGDERTMRTRKMELLFQFRR